MKSFKLSMDIHVAKEKLTTILGSPVTNLSPIEMGELSRVFSFECNGLPYVAHFKETKESLEKARYMYQTYGSRLPIPKVVEVGEIDGVFFAISDKAHGKPISAFPPSQQEIILQDVAKHLVALGQLSIDRSQGYGWISPEGSTSSTSWVETIETFFKIDPNDFYQDWTRLYDESFLERPLFEEGYSAMMELLQYAPDSPLLVHGDFHLGNMLSDGRKVTGIVDWEMAMHGDFMFDVAGLHFWSSTLDFPQKVRDVCNANKVDIPHFEERLRCYMLVKAIDGLRFYAKQDSRPSYDYMKERLKTLLKY
ncbi:aminoglycoside phosphotransferase family protein [Paenibacillus sp. N3/727]|uniref:aminoglycoside phosphotransferase family protein n=1 Tax=Paenibacillus sp. N3/727 TaxID=2925845 RepID=UPI001F535BBA|nr:aminoglycoside phosphotransferase family protein [Paenibacillus sp. N3/727]UNK19148.1 aminoglycoside phosphotransferase family protein [Paenibacillus sp. N3/727]